MCLLVESCTSAACVKESAILVVTQQQRAYAVNTIGRERESTDHKLLLSIAFQFKPAIAAARNILALCSLGDDPFAAQLAGNVKYRLCVAAQVFAEADRALSRHIRKNVGEDFFSLQQRQIAQVAAIQV